MISFEMQLNIDASADQFEFIDRHDYSFELTHCGYENTITMTITKEMFLEMVSKWKETCNEEE